MKIAIIEDNRSLVESLVDLLTSKGYEVDYFLDLREIDDYIILNSYNLIILDLMVGDLDGLEFLRIIHEDIKRPIIILTAKASKDDELRGLKLGACDYIKKPFDSDILLARIGAKLRDQKSDPVFYKQTKFDFEGGYISNGESRVDLTSIEKKILNVLYTSKGNIASKASLLSMTSDFQRDATEKTIVTHIYNIRKKILELGGCDPIESIWKEGYRWKEE